MSQSIKLYTMEPMIEAVVDSASQEPTGFEKEHMIDGNPNTYWKFTSKTTVTIDIDLQSAQAIDAVGFWIHNNSHDFKTAGSDGHSYKFQYSDDMSSYTDAAAQEGITNTIGNPIYINDITQATHRYWRLLLYMDAGATNLAELSWLFFLTEHDLGQGDEYPINDSFNYHGRLLKGAGGRTFSKAINSSKQTMYRRNFVFNKSANYTELESAIESSQNSHLPMILNLDGVNVDAVRYIGDFNISNVDHNQYRPPCLFESIPFIPDGAVL